MTQYRELSEALAEFCSRAAEKLRFQKSVTGCITIFIRTSPFNPKEPQYQRAASIKLAAATQDTRAIIATANRLLTEIYKSGYGYHKCGMQLSHIQPASMPDQFELFDFADNCLLVVENRPLMKVVDQINRRFPKAITMAATGFDECVAAESRPRFPALYDGLAGIGCC